MQFLNFYGDGMLVFAWEIVVAAGLHERHSSRAYKPTQSFRVISWSRAGHAPPLRGGQFLLLRNPVMVRYYRQVCRERS